MKMKRLFLVLTVSTVILLFATQMAQPVLARPNVSGFVSAPLTVIAGRSFKVSVSISNNGDSGAYCMRARINVPSGFSARNVEAYVGDLSPGRSRTVSFEVTAPSYAASGSFSAQVFYSSNMAGRGTMLVAYLLGQTTYVWNPAKYKVTLIIQATLAIKSAWVMVYDESTGQLVASGAGRATTSTQSSISVTVDLPVGNYKASASAMVSTPKGPANAIGWRYFSVSGTTSVLVVVFLI